MIVMTPKGARVVAKLRRRYAALGAQYGRNAADRLLYENGDVPACVVYQALGRATPHDRMAMVNQGYARLTMGA